MQLEDFDVAVSMTGLTVPYGQALRAKRPVVGTEAVLAILIRSTPYLPDKARALIRDRPPRNGHGESGAALDDHARGRVASVRAVREAQWVAWMRYQRRGGTPPVWHQGVLAALDAAVDVAKEVGTQLVTSEHVLIGLLRNPPSGVRDQLASAGLRADSLLALLEPHRADPGSFATPSLSDLTMYGARPDAVPRWLRWPARLLAVGAQRGVGGRGPLLPAVLDEAGRQAVRAGVGQVDVAHLLLAIASVNWQLEYAGVRVPVLELTRRCGQVMVAHGVTYPSLLAVMTEHAVAVVGDPAMLSLPETSGFRAVIDRAVADAASQDVQALGSQHLVPAVLAVDDGPVTRALDTLGVDTTALLTDLAAIRSE